jgi:hypothetical protein
MAIDLNLLRSKGTGPHPIGPMGPSKSRASRFATGKGFGLTKNKKGKAGARAGLGRVGRKPKAFRTVGTGVPTPAGPGGPGRSPSVRLPNRSRPAPAPAGGVKGFLGGFFKRFRKG